MIRSDVTGIPTQSPVRHPTTGVVVDSEMDERTLRGKKDAYREHNTLAFFPRLLSAFIYSTGDEREHFACLSGECARCNSWGGMVCYVSKCDVRWGYQALHSDGLMAIAAKQLINRLIVTLNCDFRSFWKPLCKQTRRTPYMPCKGLVSYYI